MMKINFPILDEAVGLKEATILTIEEVSVFSTLVQQFYQYQEDSQLKLFDKNMKSLKQSELLVITDILGFEINSSAMLKLIHADLEIQLSEKPEVKSMVENLANTITELLAYECLENELDLEYDEITVLELIKALGVKVETSSDTVFEKCFEILQIFRYLSKKKLLVLINAGAYLTENEVGKLIEYIHLARLRVLFVEPRRLYNFPQYVIDKDYFLSEEGSKG